MMSASNAYLTQSYLIFTPPLLSVWALPVLQKPPTSPFLSCLALGTNACSDVGSVGERVLLLF